MAVNKTFLLRAILNFGYEFTQRVEVVVPLVSSVVTIWDKHDLFLFIFYLYFVRFLSKNVAFYQSSSAKSSAFSCYQFFEVSEIWTNLNFAVIEFFWCIFNVDKNNKLWWKLEREMVIPHCNWLNISSLARNQSPEWIWTHLVWTLDWMCT